MNAHWVDEYVDMLLAPDAAPMPLADSTPAACTPLPAVQQPAALQASPGAIATPDPTASPAPPRAASQSPRIEPRAAHSPAPARAPAHSSVHSPMPGPSSAKRPENAPPANPSLPSLHDERERRAGADRTDSGGTRWLRVCVGDDSYALELLRVQEVLRPAPIVAMRGTPAWTLGVMNLRGRIVPVIDLGAWLGGPTATASEATRIVVVERDDELIGILVSMVEDVVTLQRERRRAAPTGQAGPTLIEDVALLTPSRTESSHANAARGATVGVARVGSVPTVLLEASRLFE